MPRQTRSAAQVRKDIVAANLRYGTIAAPLRTRAYAQVVAKVLLNEPRGTELKLERIRQGCVPLLGGVVPRREVVQNALSFLIDQEQVEGRSGGRFRLRRNAYDLLIRQVAARNDHVATALSRHFKFDIEPELLRQWFDETGVRFFSAYGDRWVAATAQENHFRVPPADVEAVASAVALEMNLTEHAGLLAWQFRDFIDSKEPEDNDVVWHFGRAMYAARLMAADLGADPITAREFRNARILLDTNVLIWIALESEEHRPAFRGLARAFRDLGIRLGYTHRTQEEYQSRITGWCTETLGLHSRFGPQVVRGAANDHVQAAVRLGAFQADDFSRFYQGIARPPGEVEGFPIALFDDTEVLEAVARGESDSALVTQIQEAWGEQRKRGPKREPVARHDAALTTVGRHFRAQGEPCWVLTGDRTMQRLSSGWTGGISAPLWISMDTLLQVLAIEEEGSSLDATAFAPLLSRLIANDVQACRYTYTLEDIQTLAQVIEGAEEMPDEDVQVIARRIHSQVLSGHGRDSEELILTISRMYQKARRRWGVDLESARSNERAATLRASGLEDKSRELRTENYQLRRDLWKKEIQEFTRTRIPVLEAAARRKRLHGLIRYAGLTTALLAVGAVVIHYGLEGASPADQVGVWTGTVGLALVPLAWGWTRVQQQYRGAIANAFTNAEKEARATYPEPTE